MNINNEVEVDKYSENPEVFVLFVESVLNKLLNSINDSELGQKRAQLIEVSRSIDQLTRLSIPIPDELRNLKLNLLTGIESGAQKKEELEQIVTNLGAIVARTKSSFSTKTSKKSKNKSKHARTENKVFEREIIDALRVVGGKGITTDLYDIISESMKDRFLPGDFDHLRNGALVWKNRVSTAKGTLKKAGILRSDSPKGEWELIETINEIDIIGHRKL